MAGYVICSSPIDLSRKIDILPSIGLNCSGKRMYCIPLLLQRRQGRREMGQERYRVGIKFKFSPDLEDPNQLQGMSSGTRQAFDEKYQRIKKSPDSPFRLEKSASLECTTSRKKKKIYFLRRWCEERKKKTYLQVEIETFIICCNRIRPSCPIP